MIFFLESGKILLTEIVSDISRPESAFTLLDNTIKHHFSGGNNPCNVPVTISASNSIRLSVYDAEKTNFKILFKEKIMAGLASYVEDGVLSPEGTNAPAIA